MKTFYDELTEKNVGKIKACCAEGKSIVVCDDNGKLEDMCGDFLKENNYEISKFRLGVPASFFPWNILRECYAVHDVSFDEKRAKIMAVEFAKGVSFCHGGAQFYSENTEELLRVAFELCAKRADVEEVAAYKKLLRDTFRNASPAEWVEQKIAYMETEGSPFRQRAYAKRLVAEKYNSYTKARQLVNEADQVEHPLNLDTLADFFNDNRSYSLFKATVINNSDKISDEVLADSVLRMSPSDHADSVAGILSFLEGMRRKEYMKYFSSGKDQIFFPMDKKFAWFLEAGDNSQEEKTVRNIFIAFAEMDYDAMLVMEDMLHNAIYMQNR